MTLFNRNAMHYLGITDDMNYVVGRDDVYYFWRAVPDIEWLGAYRPEYIGLRLIDDCTMVQWTRVDVLYKSEQYALEAAENMARAKAMEQ